MMPRGLALLLTLAFLPPLARSQGGAGDLVRFVQDQGPGYGLSYAADGRLMFRFSPGAPAEAVGPIGARHIEDFVACAASEQLEERAAAAMRSYFHGDAKQDPAFEKTLFEPRSESARLSPLGRHMLVSILIAEDGKLFRETPDFAQRLARIRASRRYGAFFDGSADPKLGPSEPLDAETLKPDGEDALPIGKFRRDTQSFGKPSRSSFQAAPAKTTLLQLGALREAGMTGKDAVVAVIDTGIDVRHPDFQGRVLEYLDLTGRGGEDRHGHGTHVAGIVGGNGAASGGAYMGAAPETKFVVEKVYSGDKESAEAFDDRMLAGLDYLAHKRGTDRPQIVNISITGDTQTSPRLEHLNQMINRLTIKDNILVVAAAGNRANDDKIHVELMGSAEYGLTVTGVNRYGRIPAYASQGPVKISGGYDYNKPDLATVAGQNVDAQGRPDASQGVVSTKSADIPCPVQGQTYCPDWKKERYLHMAGTSQATPYASGAAADVIGYLRERGVDYRATEVKALLMETARSIGASPERQGAGLMNGEELVKTTVRRVQACAPVGNIAHMLAQRLTSEQRAWLARQQRFQATGLGIVDTRTGRLIKNDLELAALLRALHPQAPASPRPRKFTY